MLSVAELSKAGSLVDLEVDLEDADTQKRQLLDLQHLASMDLQADQAVSEVASEVDLTAAEVEAVSEEDSRIGEATAGVDEEVLATREVVAFNLGEVMVEGIGVGMEVLMATTHLQMLQLVREVAVAAFLEAEEDMVDPDLQIATALQRQLVGMSRVVAVAHMMTGTADIVEAVAEVMIAMVHEEAVVAAATWSR